MVFCFGELLLRMSPSLGGKWIDESSMPVYVGGAELNVATALAGWNVPSAYYTALPQNYLADEIIEYVNSKKIDSSYIRRSGTRIGSYYLPQGADLKNAGVIYDRADSSFAGLKPGLIDWDTILKDFTWFHFSAISPALSKDIADVCKEALEVASRKGMTISVDLNYRSKLWQYGSSPTSVMPDLTQYCQVIMGNIWAVESLLGIPSPIKESNGRSRQELIAAATESFDQVREKFPLASAIAYTYRLAEDYFAILDKQQEYGVSGTFQIGDVVDRVGSGDCFMAGLIYGLYNDHDTVDIINFAAAAAVGKLHEKGDATGQTIDDVNKILAKRSIAVNE